MEIMSPEERNILVFKESGRRGGKAHSTRVEVEPGHNVTFICKYIDGQKSFKNLDELRKWLRNEIIRDNTQQYRKFTQYTIEQVDTFILERRDAGGIPYDVYSPPKKVDGTVPEG
jgi:hypothetical protein